MSIGTYMQQSFSYLVLRGGIMGVIAVIIGILLIATILQDAFETIILPRRVSRRFRLSRMFYIYTWNAWAFIGSKMHQGNRREIYLSYFGPLSLIVLLLLWAVFLILGFTLVLWGLGIPVNSPEKLATFGTYLYMSGETFTTLGFGDVSPLPGFGRVLTVAEAGTGFAFLAFIISYVPVIYQAFSRREVQISLLDARAGSPSSATELLRRQYRNQHIDELTTYLRSWEQWCAEVLESHLSYPVLTYYRSQHERQSWLAALTTILDTCSLLMVGFEGISIPSARFTFAIARHAAVDLAQTFGTPPRDPKYQRLPSSDFAHLYDLLTDAGLQLPPRETAEQRLAGLRRIYEPFVAALAEHLLVNLPPWFAPEKAVDDWQTSAWDHFAEWSPERIEEITNMLVDHRHKREKYQKSKEQSSSL